MTERDPADADVQRETDAAAAEAGSIGGRADDDQDPAMRPVEEAGGGESEGFEQAEDVLREQAEHGDPASEPASDAFPPEEDSGQIHGEPDRPLSDERGDVS